MGWLQLDLGGATIDLFAFEEWLPYEGGELR